MSGPTTSYGSWAYATGNTEGLTVEDGIIPALGDFADDYDVDGIADDLRAAINDAFAEQQLDVSLHGNEFYGPYPADPDVIGELGELIERTTALVWAPLLDKHERSHN